MHTWIHLVHQVAQLLVRLAVPACFEMVNLSLRVNYEDLLQLNPHITITHSISISIAKPAVERVRVRWKEVLNRL